MNFQSLLRADLRRVALDDSYGPGCGAGPDRTSGLVTRRGRKLWRVKFWSHRAAREAAERIINGCWVAKPRGAADGAAGAAPRRPSASLERLQAAGRGARTVIHRRWHR